MRVSTLGRSGRSRQNNYSNHPGQETDKPRIVTLPLQPWALTSSKVLNHLHWPSHEDRFTISHGFMSSRS